MFYVNLNLSRNIKKMEALREMSEKYLGDASEDRVLGAQLDEAVRSQNGIFYYRTNYDARKGSPNFFVQTYFFVIFDKVFVVEQSMTQQVLINVNIATLLKSK